MPEVIFLKSIDGKPITHENAFPLIKWKFLSVTQGNYIQDIIVSRYTENIDNLKFWTVVTLCSTRESLLLPDVGVANVKPEEGWI